MKLAENGHRTAGEHTGCLRRPRHQLLEKRKENGRPPRARQEATVHKRTDKCWQGCDNETHSRGARDGTATLGSSRRVASESTPGPHPRDTEPCHRDSYARLTAGRLGKVPAGKRATCPPAEGRTDGTWLPRNGAPLSVRGNAVPRGQHGDSQKRGE